MCGWTYVSPADSRKYYPSYVTAIYFIGIALVCCNIHMVTRRCPRQPGLMCDPVVTNDTYSDRPRSSTPSSGSAPSSSSRPPSPPPSSASASRRSPWAPPSPPRTAPRSKSSSALWKISNLLLFEALGDVRAPPPRRRPAAAPHRPLSLSLLRPANRTTRDHRPPHCRPPPPTPRPVGASPLALPRAARRVRRRASYTAAVDHDGDLYHRTGGSRPTSRCSRRSTPTAARPPPSRRSCAPSARRRSPSPRAPEQGRRPRVLRARWTDRRALEQRPRHHLRGLRTPHARPIPVRADDARATHSCVPCPRYSPEGLRANSICSPQGSACART